MNLKTLIVCMGAIVVTSNAVAEQPQQEALTPKQRQELEAKADQLFSEGPKLYGAGKLAEALRVHQEELKIRRRLHGKKDHSEVARTLDAVGFLLKAMGRHDEALPVFQQALDMQQRLYEDRDHPDVAKSLNSMGVQFYMMGRREEALRFYHRALAMRKRLHKDQDHIDVAISLNNLGALLELMGRLKEALPYFKNTLEMLERLNKEQDHPHLAVSLHNTGFLLRSMRRYEDALPYFRKALAMQKRLFKDQDHPSIANTLHNMGYLLYAMKRYQEAMPFYNDALAMQKRLYQDRDHPDVAISMNSTGSLLQAMGRLKDALPFHQDALAMNRRLYKDRNHPEIAMSLNNTGRLLKSLGRLDEALPFYRDALSMRKRLYHDRDHSHLVTSLNNLGDLFSAMGRDQQSLPFFQEALAMQGRLSERSALTGGLAAALVQVNTFGDSRSALLSASQRLVDTHVSVYDSLWKTKAALARLFRTRRALARAEKPAELNARLTELKAIQRQISGILAQPVPKAGDPTRDRRLSDVTNQQRQIEMQIAGLLPDDPRPVDLKLTDLSDALQPSEVFVDLYRYLNRAGAENQKTFRYVSFVVTAGGKPRRVELGPVEPINTATRQWRRILVEWRADASPKQRRLIEDKMAQHAATVRRLLWQPIEGLLPTGVQRIYISTDGDLGRIPFAALPGKKPGAVLLEQYSFATVESGPFLVKQLSRKKGENPTVANLLVSGGIDYGPTGRWKTLAGMGREHQQVARLWNDRGELYSQSGREATTDWLLKRLPDSRFVHLATHGEFRAGEYAEERQRLEESMRQRIAAMVNLRTGAGSSGATTPGSGLGVRNPLGYVGVVMAGANDPREKSPDRGILSGASIWPLDLSKTELAVLSACETGLGEHTGGAGVQNLALAFHVAGCRNVIASLWKVDDEATAALMTKFYHELWVNEKSIIDALREAQLLVYRRPDLIPDLAGSRGALKLTNSLDEKPTGGSVQREGWPSRTPSKYWAAFILSGIGK